MAEDQPRKLTTREKRWEFLAWHSEDLTPIQRLCLLALFRWHIMYPEIFLSEPKLAKLAGCKERAVRSALSELEVEGWFMRGRQGKGITARVYTYVLCFPKWFDEAQDAVMLRWHRERLIARLQWRMEQDTGWENWTDAEGLLTDLVKLGVDLVAVGVDPEVAEVFQVTKSNAASGAAFARGRAH